MEESELSKLPRNMRLAALGWQKVSRKAHDMRRENVENYLSEHYAVGSPQSRNEEIAGGSSFSANLNLNESFGQTSNTSSRFSMNVSVSSLCQVAKQCGHTMALAFLLCTVHSRNKS